MRTKTNKSPAESDNAISGKQPTEPCRCTAGDEAGRGEHLSGRCSCRPGTCAAGNWGACEFRRSANGWSPALSEAVKALDPQLAQQQCHDAHLPLRLCALGLPGCACCLEVRDGLGVVGHGSDPRLNAAPFRAGVCGGHDGQLRPYQLPVVGAQVLAGYSAVRVMLDLDAARGRRKWVVAGPIGYLRLVDVESRRERRGIPPAGLDVLG